MKLIGRLSCLVVSAILAALACEPYDDTAIRERPDDLDRRLASAEGQLPQLNSDISAMISLTAAMESKLSITGVEAVDGGFRISFSDGSSHTLRSGNDGKSPTVGSNGNWWVGGKDTGTPATGKDGATPYIGSNGNWWIGGKDSGIAAAGTSGSTPVIGIRELDGVWYWTQTLDGFTNYLTDATGNKVPVSGNDAAAPVLDINDEGYWTVSLDGGITFQYVLDSTGNPVKAVCGCTTFFLSVSYTGDYLILVLTDGTIVRIKLKGSEDRPIDEVLYPIKPDDLPDIPIYDGDNPPFVEGAYYVHPFVTVYCEDEGRGGFSPGTEVRPIVIRFSNQDLENNTIDYDSYGRYGGNFQTGKGAFIRGEGDNFSCFFNTEGGDGSVYYKTALVVSGTKVPEGIKDLYYAFVMVEKRNDKYHRYMDEGVYRIFYDSDHISEYCTWDPPYHPDTPDIVDLDLPSGTLWGSYNLGASQPWEYGDYFAWGETVPKESYLWSNYKYVFSSSPSKYVTDPSKGTYDGLTTLEEDDDAAAVNLGEKWRTPTKDEIEELRSECTWTWTTIEGVYGYIVRSRRNDKTIFLPAAGSRTGTNLYNAGKSGVYWSSNISDSSDKDGGSLVFGYGFSSLQGGGRDMGYTIRPVFGERAKIVTVTGITIEEDVIELEEGEEYRLSVTVLPADASDKVVRWSSDNPEIADVDDDGIVSAYRKGTATITATTRSGGHSASCVVRVVSSSVVDEPDKVDLGLPSGTLWGSFNLGASKPWEFGDYYAWGEIEPKDEYTAENYRWYNGNPYTNGYAKYNASDGKMQLDAEDDAAAVTLGGEWRMPTRAEMIELMETCDWVWTRLEGVYGYDVKGRNGKSIFLPAGGHNGLWSSWKDEGCYWSASLDPENSRWGEGLYAYHIWFDDIRIFTMDEATRPMGKTIRPVYATRKEYVPVTGIWLKQYDLELKVGETYTIDPAFYGVYPYNATDQDVHWRSEDFSIATVTDDGVITGVKEGTTTVMVYSANEMFTDTFTVTVVAASSSSGVTYVDLDLPSGTRWASCNVGAENPEDYGDYFAWGEIETKSNYDWSTYKWCEKESETHLTKYNTLLSFGLVDNLTTLVDSDNAGYILLGFPGAQTLSKVLIPTKEQQDELREYCNWTWTSLNVVKGYRVSSKSDSGKSIFLPAAGNMQGTELKNAGAYGHYWSREMVENYCSRAYYLFFNDNGNVTWSLGSRAVGQSVRSVAKNPNK